MNKIYHFILFCFATLCLAACSDDDPEVSGIDGKDHFISEFALTVDGITYQAMIVGDKITVEIPYNTSLKGEDRNKQNRRQPDHRNGRRRRNHQSGRTCQPETNQ